MRDEILMLLKLADDRRLKIIYQFVKAILEKG